MRTAWILTGFSIASAVGVVAAWLFLAPDTRDTEPASGNIITGEFSLVDHTGKPTTHEDFRGSWLLVFFGYTHCPDVCPTTMGTIALAMEDLGADAAKLRPLFITVDPERDTPEVLSEYVAAFDSRIVGLTGTQDQTAAAAKAFRAHYTKILLFEGDQVRTDDYAMGHTAHLFLIDPAGNYAGMFSPTAPVETVVAGLRRYLNR